MSAVAARPCARSDGLSASVFIHSQLAERLVVTSGSLGTKLESDHLVWQTRGYGFDVPQERSGASRPLVETIASRECIVATRLWERAKELDEANPLVAALTQGAIALKAMGLTAAGADAILAPYTDVHDAYHRIKRERHSFEPHYNKAMALLGEGTCRALARNDPDRSLRRFEPGRSSTHGNAPHALP